MQAGSLLDAARRGLDAGRARWGDLGVGADALADDAAALVSTRRAALGLGCDDGELARAAASLAWEDLYLARACEGGDERAWRALHAEFGSRLFGLAVARGVRGADSQSLVADVLSDLALPAPGGRARTLIGTFAGSGSLWAWLAATLVRRVARAAAERMRPSAEAAETAVASPPWRDQVDLETAARLDAALREAWTLLEPEERVCLAWKHRHGLEQHRIARLLGVGEHQVSRHLSRAVAKVRAAVARCAGTPDGDDAASLWMRLAEVVADNLARLDVEAPPSGDAGPRAERSVP